MAAGPRHVCRQQARERMGSAFDVSESEALPASNANDRAEYRPGGIARGPDQIAGERDGVIHAPDHAGRGVTWPSFGASLGCHREAAARHNDPDTVCYRLRG